jgi:AcrR family transcriptional regulator
MDTRTKILETAARLFSAHGYDNTSLAHVAKHASVSKALIFWHFENKENLFEAVLSRTIAPYEVENDEDLRCLTGPEQLFELVDRYLEFVNDNAESVRMFLGMLLTDGKAPDEFIAKILELHDHYRKLVAETIRQGQEGGTLSRDVDPELYSGLIMGALHGIFVRRMMGEAGGPGPESLVEELKDKLIARLRVQ